MNMFSEPTDLNRLIILRGKQLNDDDEPVAFTLLRVTFNCQFTPENMVDFFKTKLDKIYIPFHPDSVNYNLRRLSNAIARSAKRGPANYIMCNAKTAETYKDGFNNFTMDVNELLNDNEIFIYYKGTTEYDVMGFNKDDSYYIDEQTFDYVRYAYITNGEAQ